MANFKTPFANTGARREPTPTEMSDGFPIGAADKELFNGLAYRVEAELGTLVSAGLPNAPDNTTDSVLKSIQALINAAVPDANKATYLTEAQYLGHINSYSDVTESTFVDGGSNLLTCAKVEMSYKGYKPVSIPNVSLTLLNSKIYHVRHTLAGGVVAIPLDDATYNPNSKPDNDASFDTKREDILLARATVDAKGVITIVNLANRQLFSVSNLVVGIPKGMNGQKDAVFSIETTFNTGRTPVDISCAVAAVEVNNTGSGERNKNFIPSDDYSKGNARLSNSAAGFKYDRYGFFTQALYDDAQLLTVLVNGTLEG